MKRYMEQLNTVQQATFIWIALIVATISAALMSLLFKSGVVLLVVSVILLIFKGQMVVDHFMALRHVSTHWRRLMSAYCIVIGGFVIAAYLMGLS